MSNAGSHTTGRPQLALFAEEEPQVASPGNDAGRRYVNRRVDIADGPGHFPHSVVLYTHFFHSDLRRLFAYLRTKEHMRQKEHAQHEKGSIAEILTRGRLYELQEILAYFVNDYPSDPERSVLPKGEN